MPPAGQSSTTPAIVAAVFVILAVSVLAAVSAMVVILIVLRRKKKTKEAAVVGVHYSRNEKEGSSDLPNPLYSGMTNKALHYMYHISSSISFTQTCYYVTILLQSNRVNYLLCLYTV